MNVRRGQLVAAIAVVLAVVTGCTSDARRSGITIDTLAGSTGTACPVPLDVAVTAAGVDRKNTSTGSVEASRSFSATSGAPQETTALDAVEGVFVQCTLALDGGRTLELDLVAGRRGEAGLILLPTVQLEADLTSDRVQQIGNDLSRTKIGGLVAVPGQAPVALMHSEVSGAPSSYLLVYADSLTRNQVEQIARQLHDRLR